MNEREHTLATSPPQQNALPLEEPTIMRPRSELFQCCHRILSQCVCWETNWVTHGNQGGEGVDHVSIEGIELLGTVEDIAAGNEVLLG